MKSIYKLKKDLVIPEGTVFSQAPVETTRNGNHIQTTIGLSKDSCGFVEYCLDDMENVDEWFDKDQKQ